MICSRRVVWTTFLTTFTIFALAIAWIWHWFSYGQYEAHRFFASAGLSNLASSWRPSNAANPVTADVAGALPTAPERPQQTAMAGRHAAVKVKEKGGLAAAKLEAPLIIPAPPTALAKKHPLAAVKVAAMEESLGQPGYICARTHKRASADCDLVLQQPSVEDKATDVCSQCGKR
jgi:hypothetical protein